MNVPERKCVTAKRVGGPDCRRAGAVASRNGTDKPGAADAPRSALERSNGHIVAIMRHGCVRSEVRAAPKPAADAVGKTAGQAGGRAAGAGPAQVVRAASGDRRPEGTVPAAGAPGEKTVAWPPAFVLVASRQPANLTQAVHVPGGSRSTSAWIESGA